MKYFVSALLSFAISVSAFAQNSPGADYFSLGETKLAKEYFTKNISQNPEESHFYLGEIAYKEGNLTEAKAQYQQSAAVNPELLGLGAVGLAKLELKSNPKAAEDQLKDVQKKNKKDVNVLLAIAKAYFDNGLKEKALNVIVEAKKADKKNPYIYIFEGDM
ncbi:MAG: tetratricopeptide repeat protein, partial [Prevotella sp.]|nr:tetratricopeptide repeat protein [Prevotella sp.]